MIRIFPDQRAPSAANGDLYSTTRPLSQAANTNSPPNTTSTQQLQTPLLQQYSSNYPATGNGSFARGPGPGHQTRSSVTVTSLLGVGPDGLREAPAPTSCSSTRKIRLADKVLHYMDLWVNPDDPAGREIGKKIAEQGTICPCTVPHQPFREYLKDDYRGNSRVWWGGWCVTGPRLKSRIVLHDCDVFV